MLTKRNTLFKISLMSERALVLLKLGEEYILNKKSFLVLDRMSDYSKKELLSLKKRFLVELKNDKTGFVAVRLTQDGFLEFLKLLIIESDKLPDGEVVIVVFDIPEKFRRQRNLLNKFLENGIFVRVQKSVWVSQFGCADILGILFDFFGIKKWTRVYLAKESEKFQLLDDRLKNKKNR